MEINKPIIWIIGGGEVFETRENYLKFLENEYEISSQKSWDWKKWLTEGLSDHYDITKINMPDKMNADYDAWKIVFEKYIDTLDTNQDISIIGHSLGGIFLAKYLSENVFPKKISSLHLVAPVWTHPESKIHNTWNFSFHPMSLSKLPSKAKNIYIWWSEDDDIVNFEDFEKYSEALPMADFRIFRDRWHFIGSHFVELFTTFL